jgi:tryptophan-rich sensory protein
MQKSQLGGILGGLAMKNQIKNWYDVQIVKPKWRPPNWVKF